MTAMTNRFASAFRSASAADAEASFACDSMGYASAFLGVGAALAASIFSVLPVSAALIGIILGIILVALSDATRPKELKRAS